MATAKRAGAGALSEVIAFQVRGGGDDGAGNPVSGDFETQFHEPCRLIPMKGTEPVLAQRLVGLQPFILRVRSSSRTRRVTNAWRAMNQRAGVTYNIKTAANIDERNGYIDMIAVQGEAS